jgi:predicted DNA repair protein MutK
VATGLIALLDDVAAIAKVAAASLDDTMTQAAQAGAKAAGVVIDDAAVTPRYVVGFSADRELPIVGKIALGSLKNKLLYLLPAALLLSLAAPWAITPLLMAGGAYLCYEGVEKLWHAWHAPPDGHAEETAGPPGSLSMENRKVGSAIRTDFILSAEIMALTLATVAGVPFWEQAAVLAVVGIFITMLVYGGVALIVKADDAGVALSRARDPAGAFGFMGAVARGAGRGLVLGMPVFLRILAAIGTAAMIWVGGGIVIHGLESFGLGAAAHAVHAAAVAAAAALPAVAGAAEWLVSAAASGVVGLAVGALLIPLVQFGVALFGRFRAARRPDAS